MLNDAMQIVLQFRVFLIAAIVVALVLEIALLFGTKKFGWQRRNLWIYGFFFGLTKSQCYFLAASCLWLLFAATSALFVVDMQVCHLAMLLLLSAAKFAAWKRKLVLLRDLLNSALLFAAMMAENLLHSYLMETRFQIQIVVVLCLLILFIVLYAVYFAVRDVQNLMQFRAVRKAEKEDEIDETDETNQKNENNQADGLEKDSEDEPKRKRRSRKKMEKKRRILRKNGKKQEVMSSETETNFEK